MERSANGTIDASWHVNKDHWYVYSAPNDKPYYLDRPNKYGRTGHLTPRCDHIIKKIDRGHNMFTLTAGIYSETCTPAFACS